MERLIYILISFLFVGCSANWHIKKAIKKDHSILLTDTITVVDTLRVITNNVSTDSTFILSRDTVVLKKDKLTIKHYYYRDSIYLWGECESDTIYKPFEVKVPVDKIIINEPLFPRWLWWIVILFIGLFVLNRLLK